MSKQLEQLLIERNSDPVKKVAIERRLRYNDSTGKIIDWSHVNATTVWDEPYLVIQDDTLVYPIRQKVEQGVIVDVDTTIYVYWRSTPAVTLENNPYFVIESYNEKGI
tara:strand:- start:247 stop:570 length:324 start_codon:yes stop_codon:yes gene_type:complete